MNEIAFTVFGRPQQRGSKQAMARYGRDGKPLMKDGRVLTFAKDDNPKSKDWMTSVAQVGAEKWAGNKLLQGSVILSVRFFFKRPKSHYYQRKSGVVLREDAPLYMTTKPDLAKLVRCLEDALTGIVWVDDNQVCIYREVAKLYTTDSERAHVTIWEM